MNPLSTFVRSLGNDGALANAQIALEVRVREDGIVRGLAHRLERSAASAALAAPAVAAPGVVSTVA